MHCQLQIQFLLPGSLCPHFLGTIPHLPATATTFALSKQVLGRERGTVELAKCPPHAISCRGPCVIFRPQDFLDIYKKHLCLHSQTEFSIPGLHLEGRWSQLWRLGVSYWWELVTTGSNWPFSRPLQGKRWWGVGLEVEFQLIFSGCFLHARHFPIGLQRLTHFLLIAILWGQYCYLFLIHEETEIRRG